MSQFYDVQKNTLLGMLSVNEVTALLVSGEDVFSGDHVIKQDIPPSTILDQAVMTHAQVSEGAFYADDLVFPNTRETDFDAQGLVFVFSDTGMLISHIDAGFPITPNGENIHIQWAGPVFTF